MLSGPIIAPDSPLRQIPVALNDRQRLFIDGIRYSIEMADVAFTRLSRALLSITPEGKLAPESGFPEVYLDSWSVVDMVHRLRTLVQNMPGLKHSPPLEVLVRATAGVEDLRNSVQHLIGEFDKNSSQHHLPWGRLAWVSGPNEDGSLWMRVMIAGACTTTNHPFVNPLGEPVQVPIDKITLDAHGYRLNLSDTLNAVQAFTGRLETAWRRQIGATPMAAGADVVLSLSLTSADPNRPLLGEPRFEPDVRYREHPVWVGPPGIGIVTHTLSAILSSRLNSSTWIGPQNRLATEFHLSNRAWAYTGGQSSGRYSLMAVELNLSSSDRKAFLFLAVLNQVFRSSSFAMESRRSVAMLSRTDRRRIGVGANS